MDNTRTINPMLTKALSCIANLKIRRELPTKYSVLLTHIWNHKVRITGKKQVDIFRVRLARHFSIVEHWIPVIIISEMESLDERIRHEKFCCSFSFYELFFCAGSTVKDGR